MEARRHAVNIRSQPAPALTPQTLALAKPALQRPRYERDRVKIGIVHIGPGAFHRAHQAFYVDELLARDLNWGICAVSLRSNGVRDALVPQGGLYTLAILDRQPQFRAIGAIKELLVAPESPEVVLGRLTNDATRIVTITVTEKGYCLGADGALDVAHPDVRFDRAHPASPRTVVGYLAEALRRRRASGIRPFTVVSCDNLSGNGRRLRDAVVRFASDLDGDLARWIDGEVAFPRTMVDSITPASDEALRERVIQETGLFDAWPVQREASTQWVIEDVAGPAPPWDSIGVTITADVSGYERAKLRLLNGAHSSLAYLGLLKGHETVAEAMNDSELAALIRAMMIEDIAPSVRPPRGLDVASYIEVILARFRNPSVRHLLSQIAWDGSAKLPVRLLPTIAEALITGRPTHRLCWPLAAWMHFVRRQTAAGRELIDPLARDLAQAARACRGEPSDVMHFLNLASVFPSTLSGSAVFRTDLSAAYAFLLDPSNGKPVQAVRPGE
jgi:fructuronate reductase